MNSAFSNPRRRNRIAARFSHNTKLFLHYSNFSTRIGPLTLFHGSNITGKRNRLPVIAEDLQGSKSTSGYRKGELPKILHILRLNYDFPSAFFSGFRSVVEFR